MAVQSSNSSKQHIRNKVNSIFESGGTEYGLSDIKEIRV